MRHVNYVRWAEYIKDLFEWAGKRRIQSVLELACGTGKMLGELSQAGYRMYGLDSSLEMVKMAAYRLSKLHTNGVLSHLMHGQRGAVWCGDMQSFALVAPVDAAICLYDSFNYSLEIESSRQLLDGVAQAVHAGGLFIFDVCTVHNCRRNFNNYYEREDFGMYSYIRRAHFKLYRKIQVNEFLITNEIDGGPILYERHEQRIYTLREIHAMIDPRQWKVAGCFDGMSRRAATEKSDRVHFVLERL
jgi:SAM-dependent methyltransferase